MIKFLATIILLVLAFFVGKNWAGEFVDEQIQITSFPMQSEFDQLSTQEIIALIHATRLHDDNIEKHAKLQGLITILNDRLAE